MMGMVLALLGSAVVARAWLTLSYPDDSQDSSGDTADGASLIGSPLNALTGAHGLPYSTSDGEGYFPALKFALDLPHMLPDFPSAMLGEAPASDNLDWANGGFVHDSLPQSVSETAPSSGGSSAWLSDQFSFLSPQLSGPLSTGGLERVVPPDAGSVVPVTQSVPEPGETGLIAVGLAALLVRCAPRRLIPCRKEVVQP